MAASRGRSELRYQLPKGIYRELIMKPQMVKFLKERFAAMRKLRELGEDLNRLPDGADELALVKAAAEDEVAAGTPIVVLAWQVQVSRYGHRIAAAPSWLTTSATTSVRIYADDTCEPASS